MDPKRHRKQTKSHISISQSGEVPVASADPQTLLLVASEGAQATPICFL